MTETSTPTKKLQWRWVGISMVLYALFYLLPLIIFAMSAEVLTSVWVFAGVIIISAVAGYLSEGITIVEPAIAGAGLMFLFFIAMIVVMPQHINVSIAAVGMAVVMVGIFLLSLLGAWLGERAQKLWASKPSEPAIKQG